MRNLKKVIALVAVFALLVSTVAFAQTYSDVAETDAYAEAIETLSMLGILTGDDADGDGQMDFRPADTITRAEVAAIVCRIQNMNSAAQTTTPFTDVPSTHWASGYVSQAAGQGIVNGYGDGNFGPDDNVTYEQVIKMLMETLGYNLFAADNGGYPTGYLTAAQRYGVLEGVIGGGSGTEANRGMVAQMVYNAIDTPLMDKYYYGKDATYMIYDGTNAKYMTLMSRDLKIVKASGTVTANSYTDLETDSTAVNTDSEKTIVLTVDGSDVNAWYLSLAEGETKQFKQGDVNADALLGYAVNVYAKENTNGSYTLLSATKDTAKNEEVSFTLDLYQGIDGQKLSYLKDENASNDSTVTAAANAQIIYNGVAAGTTLSDFFAAGKIEKDGKLNGKVTLIDTKDATGYDVVNIEVATTAVVKQVTATGAVTFKASVSPFNGNRLSKLTFDEEDTATIINLTKNGEAIDYTELNEWDVLSIKNGATNQIYDVTVLAEDNYVDSYVKATRTDNKVMLADGNLYEVDANGYMVTPGTLEAGDSGRFYIDAYGKIVALNDDIVVEGVDATAADNYALVLNAVEGDDTWGKMNVTLQILDKSGAVYEAQLASSVTVKNLVAQNQATLAQALNGATVATNKDDFTFKIDGMSTQNAKDLAKALTGKLISYTANSAGAISGITFTQTRNKEDDMYQAGTLNTVNTNVMYDEDDMKLGNIQIDEDTYVFYMTNAAGNAGNAEYANDTKRADADYSRVGKGSELSETSYDYIAFDTGDDVAKAIVILNTTGEISPAAHVAIIDGIGQSSSNGSKVYVVDYWMNGELLTATTATDLTDIEPQTFSGTTETSDPKKSAAKGDVFQLKVSNGIITSAQKLHDYNRDAISGAVTLDKTNFSYGVVSNKSESVYGAIWDISKRGNLTLQENGLNASISAKDAETANVYVFDPNKNEARRISVGSLADAYQDDILTEGYNGNTTTISYKDGAGDAKTLTAGSADAYKLLDYAYAYNYDGDSIDIVIYKAYKFAEKYDFN